MSKAHLYILTFLLFSAGLGLFLYKAIVLRFPLRPDITSSLWTVEAAISFVSKDKPVKISFFIPKSDKYTAVVDESFISPGFGLTTTQKKLNRRAEWTIRKTSGPQRIFYRAVVRKLEPDEIVAALPPSGEKEPAYQGADLAAADSLIKKIRSESADTDSFVKTLLTKLQEPSKDENIRLLLGKKATDEKRVIVAARILQIAGVSARAEHGFRLKEQLREARMEHWLEVYEQGRWQIYGRDGETDSPEEQYVVWWRGEKPLLETSGAGRHSVRFSVSYQQEEAINSAIARAGLSNRSLLDYSPFSLPIETQAVYRIILLVPIGALVIVLLRNVIGMQTFGTFMPVLIALAFRETELLAGIALFVIIVALGLAVRFYLEHLKLLLVPRLAAIVTVVVLLMCGVSIVGHKLGLETGLSAALFPMVIMTMTIERMSIVWEEVGSAAALMQSAGTLVVAALAYLVITNREIEHLVFVFPELLLVVLSLTLLLGRYTGYRLFELYRFRLLSRE